jgi:hypothetical protein
VHVNLHAQKHAQNYMHNSPLPHCSMSMPQRSPGTTWYIRSIFNASQTHVAVSLKSTITSQLQYPRQVTMTCCLKFAMASPLQAVSLKFAITPPLQYHHQCHTATLPHRHAGISSENPTDQRIHHIVRSAMHLSDNPSKDTEPIADQ